MFDWITAAVVLIIVHEAGHVLTAQYLGGRFVGFSRRGMAVGVRLDLADISPHSRRLTLWGGPLAEAAAVVGVLLAITTGSLLPQWGPPITLIAAADLAINLVPWWHHNDGARILATLRQPPMPEWDAPRQSR